MAAPSQNAFRLVLKIMDSYKENPLKNLFYIDFGIQGLMWIHSAWNRTEKFYDLTGVWVIVTLLPSIMVNLADTTHPARINNLDYAGWCLWLVGFALEATADFQKSQFRKNPANQGKFVNTGLWSISRHPNYLGEIIMWFALYLPAFNATNGWTRWLLVLCPAFDAFLLTSVSGIPLLEKHGMKKWGSEPGYQQYLKATSVLIPYLW
ncbi:unnamed protein product [Notodromas monacha]|uniref:Steroid 5-alpha reductase C-terminal domain-containing protein n=1 Tax=Notodromas monacha TaxID=399045 RepID=A0A7R9GBX6_9CRUS|nr:unnamed protein product [Notodromas monacha]CAG0915427.1 unnamed protein product [Notodromas monacha]